MNFPDDADGDVLKRLGEQRFDFSKCHQLDFNVDFDSWPPPKVALEILEAEFGPLEVYDPEEGYDGYVLFNVEAQLTYDLVIQTQRRASSLVSGFGGICESWGVSH